MMDFGCVTTLYKGASAGVRNEIAVEVGVAARVLDSWLVAINTLRNCCAHHARLWNREFGTMPKIPRDNRWHEPYEVENHRVFALFTVMSFLLETAAPKTGWRSRLLALIKALPEEGLRSMGFSDGWEKYPLWKPWAKATVAEANNDTDQEDRNEPLPGTRGFDGETLQTRSPEDEI